MGTVRGKEEKPSCGSAAVAAVRHRVKAFRALVAQYGYVTTAFGNDEPLEEKNFVSSVSTQTTASKLALPHGKFEVSVRTLDLPSLLRCLVLSWSDQRAQLLLTAAENEAWQTIVSRDAQDFVRKLFQSEVPLTVVDLPRADAASYGNLREAVSRSVEVSDSLLIVCGVGGNPAEELWARQLGVWTYLPGANDQAGLEMVFGEARKALAKQAIACVEVEPEIGRRSG